MNRELKIQVASHARWAETTVRGFNVCKAYVVEYETRLSGTVTGTYGWVFRLA